MSQNITVLPDGSASGTDPANSVNADGLKTVKDQGSFDLGLNTGFAKGINKGKSELLEALGVKDLEKVKAAVKFQQEHEEAEKSASEKLNAATAKAADLEKRLKEYEERDSKEAEGLYSKLSDDQKKIIDATGVAKEKLVPVIKGLLGDKTNNTRSVGTSFSPANNDAEDGSSNTSKHTGLDPEYKKNKGAFIKAHLEKVEKNRKD